MNDVPEAGDKPSADRRPIAARQSSFAKRLTALLLKTPITPNQISVISIAFAAIAAVAILFAPRLLTRAASAMVVERSRAHNGGKLSRQARWFPKVHAVSRFRLA